MNQCEPHTCPSCRSLLKTAKAEMKAEARDLRQCRKGPTPAFVEDCEDEEDPKPLPPATSEDPAIELEDRIFAVMVNAPELWIHVTSTISQRLAEAHHKNSAPVDSVPDYLRDLHKVFAKESFDVLPKSTEWDHAIELIPDAIMKTCKVYPMSVAEMKELDAFLREHLASGRIRPSKSPMASPVFFLH